MLFASYIVLFYSRTLAPFLLTQFSLGCTKEERMSKLREEIEYARVDVRSPLPSPLLPFFSQSHMLTRTSCSDRVRSDGTSERDLEAEAALCKNRAGG